MLIFIIQAACVRLYICFASVKMSLKFKNGDFMAIVFKNNMSYTSLGYLDFFIFALHLSQTERIPLDSGTFILQFLQLIVCYFSRTDNTTGPTMSLLCGLLVYLPYCRF